MLCSLRGGTISKEVPLLKAQRCLASLSCEKQYQGRVYRHWQLTDRAPEKCCTCLRPDPGECQAGCSLRQCLAAQASYTHGCWWQRCHSCTAESALSWPTAQSRSIPSTFTLCMLYVTNCMDRSSILLSTPHGTDFSSHADAYMVSTLQKKFTATPAAQSCWHVKGICTI